VKRVAVTGAEGNLGKELVGMGCVPLHLDITGIYQIRDEVKKVEPDVIINCAAKSHVDGCESKEGEKLAVAVNTRGIANLREIYDGQIIHLSTGYVFNGKRGPYKEKGKPDPLQGYGFSKWAGEVIFQSYNRPDDVIVRTMGLYGGHKPDFSNMVLDALEKQEQLAIFKDMKFNATYIPHLAKALMELVDIIDPPKIVNIAGKEVLSRYEFAKKIAQKFGYDQKYLTSITTKNADDFFVAARPKNAGLKTDLARKIGLSIYSVVDGLDDLRYKWKSQ
jgi:dTDP-4-dehydrorhamnose reductase